MYQINTLCALNLCNFISQLCLSKVVGGEGNVLLKSETYCISQLLLL